MLILKLMRVYSRSALSKPYTSRIDMSCLGSMLVMLWLHHRIHGIHLTYHSAYRKVGVDVVIQQEPRSGYMH